MTALAVFMFDEDAGAWWVETATDLADHDPPAGVFVMEVDQVQLQQLEEHRNAWAKLSHDLVTASGLAPSDPCTVDVCPEWQGEPYEYAGATFHPLCQRCAHSRPDHDRTVADG